MNPHNGGQPDEPAEVDLWPDPQPLPDILPRVALFDPKMLPDAVRAFVVDVSERMQCPIDFPAVAMMIVLAGVLMQYVWRLQEFVPALGKLQFALLVAVTV